VVVDFESVGLEWAGVGNREAFGFAHRADGEPGGLRNFEVRRLASEFAREVVRRASDEVHARTGAPRQRIESTQFIEDRAADPSVAIRASFRGWPVETQQRFDQRDLARAREVFAGDVQRQATADVVKDGFDDGEGVDELGKRW
jgi:hypothetical protein